MKKHVVTLCIVTCLGLGTAIKTLGESKANGHLALPSPRVKSPVSLEETLKNRRSVRAFSNAPITLEHAAQLLWAAQGITHDSDRRTAPSAGALYPLEVYLVAGNVTGLPAGVYRYQPRDHQLILISPGDKRKLLSTAALNQTWIQTAPAALVITGVYERTQKKYGDRASRFVHLEAGAAAQNVLLQAVALKLAATFVGAIDDKTMKEIFNLPEGEQSLAILPVGRLQ